jgi:hypothetical protein
VARSLSRCDPALLPIERPTAYELAVNRGAPGHLGLSLPPPMEALVTALGVMRQ